MNAIQKLHQPSLNRVQIPGIMLDRPACTECSKAWPCPTYEAAEETPLTEPQRLAIYTHNAANELYEQYSTSLLEAVSVRTHRAETHALNEHVCLAAFWNEDVKTLIRNDRDNGTLTRALQRAAIMPVQQWFTTYTAADEALAMLESVLAVADVYYGH